VRPPARILALLLYLWVFRSALTAARRFLSRFLTVKEQKLIGGKTACGL
jgi:hypothetical protein